MTILYSNGCSFTANMEVKRENRYPFLIGQHFGWETNDRAIPGNCNSKIIRCAIRDCIRLLDRNDKIIALIQLTFAERWEYAGDPEGPNHWQYQWSDDLFETIKPADENNWPPGIRDFAKQLFVSQKPQALYQQLFGALLGLTSFFKHYKIDYRIFAGPAVINDDSKIFKSDVLYGYLSQDLNIIDLRTFNMLGLTGRQIHPDDHGMEKIAAYFINQLGAPK